MKGLLLLLAILTMSQQWANAQCTACQHAVNVVTNGAFSSGNSGFTSELEYVTGLFTCPLCPENTYTIGANAIFYHSGFFGSDHTNPPSGNFFIANGQGAANSAVWCETVAVQPYTDYTFTFWAQDVNSNSDPHPLAELQASFNGMLTTDTLIVAGGWMSYIMSWNSGSALSLDLCIYNQQWQTGGNDFGLDDISLVGCHDYHLSQPAYAGGDQVVCSNVEVQLGQSGVPGYTYQWDHATGLSSITEANPDFAIENIGPGDIHETYILTTDSAGVGCIRMDTVMMTVLPSPTLDLGPNIMICPGAMTTLDAGPGWDGYIWSTGEDVQSISASVGNHSVSAYFNTCSSSDTINIEETTLPVIDLGPDQQVCENEAIILLAGIVGMWSDGTIADSLIVSEQGAYSFYYESDGCEVMDEVFIEVFTMPILVLPTAYSFCEGTSILLDAGTPGLWNTGVVGPTVTVTDGGSYDIVAENGPCIASAGTSVEMIPLPVVDLAPDTTVCDGQQVHLQAYAVQNNHYEWSTGDTLSELSIYVPGTYHLEVSNECGTALDTIDLYTYLCDWALYIPDSFTPNDDGINEGWSVQGYNVSNVKISVYNRFGNLVFMANDLGKAWQPGTGIGDDIYNYRIEAIAFDGENIEQYGHIYLLR